jgi:hypothetical protein
LARSDTEQLQVTITVVLLGLFLVYDITVVLLGLYCYGFACSLNMILLEYDDLCEVKSEKSRPYFS